MQFVIIYMRIQETKKDLVFNGPFYGNIHNTYEDAEIDIKDLVNNSKSGTILAKVFNVLDDQPFTIAMEKARPVFERMKKDIIETKEMIDRPVYRRKKKKRI